MKSSKIRNWLLLLLSVILLFVAVQYITLSVLSVRKVFIAASTNKNTDQTDLNTKDSTWLELYRQKNWLESRLKMSQSDSIYLSINLRDSALQLELKGVVLKSSPIVQIKYDRFFDALPASAYHHYFGQETVGNQSLATIDKIPLTIKQAPRDSAEFAAQNTITDTIKNEEINWMLTLDNGILLKIKGIDDDDQKLPSSSFWRQQKLKQIVRDLSNTILFKLPNYQPSIELLVGEEDAKAIYRAIPVQPMVCIRL